MNGAEAALLCCVFTRLFLEQVISHQRFLSHRGTYQVFSSKLLETDELGQESKDAQPDIESRLLSKPEC